MIIVIFKINFSASIKLHIILCWWNEVFSKERLKLTNSCLMIMRNFWALKKKNERGVTHSFA